MKFEKEKRKAQTNKKKENEGHIWINLRNIKNEKDRKERKKKQWMESRKE